jgi:starch synthase
MLRTKNKRAILNQYQLEFNEEIPLIILISRLYQQKGIDIALEGLRIISDQPWQAILLGTGDKRLEQACKELEADLPHKVRAAITFNINLSRRLYGSADLLLMPSRYEPCGLSQMFAMRYGCLPVARATGGLVDTITDPKSNGASNGFLFSRIDPRSFAQTMTRALNAFYQKKEWQQMQKNAMSCDFSWQRSAETYVQHYQNLLNKSKN